MVHSNYSITVTIDTPLPANLPVPCTIRHLATHYLDIQCVPRRYFFELLMNFTKSPMEKERLAEFCSADGQVSNSGYKADILICLQDELYSYCNRVRRTSLEVLMDFPSATANIPLTYLFDLFPEMQPRAFSIASSTTVSIAIETHFCM